MARLNRGVVANSRCFYGSWGNEPSSQKHTSLHYRPYQSSPHRYNPEYEKQKYDYLMRQQLVKNTIQNNPNFITPGGQLFQNNNGLPFKTILMLIVTSSSLTMAGYLLWQIDQLKDQVESGNEGDITTKSIFLPIWLNCNWIYVSRYRYPDHIYYFDPEYFEYLQTEMNQLNSEPGKISDKDNYLKLLITDNIQYKVLETASIQSSIREIFGLPININQSSNFDIWVEPKHPTISGIRFDIELDKSEGKTNYVISPHWSIKLINFTTIISDLLVAAGLKLDRLNTSEAQAKTHERGSGRVHEVPLNDSKKLRKHKHPTMHNLDKDYNVIYTGNYVITDNNNLKKGIIEYKGIIDFDHLTINRGVKIIELNLCMKESDGKSQTTYKLI
ncbi:hypothetical protein HYPBUDRAFT_107022 [Hyphopichia burtonii NRRL Y-1933]|uniref:Uncharacterized protein n=1 Tax=Hyphopichia burtonii NRRL Y-1933 TaxID=984485 RepID=A0A1E4RLQ4_9ASCO|nr:hypothetical protein HYPBUDRAFT_107022 [Hyphopichia burtonii NRRL Y-1933]ODV68198.1 hypothetical protein HYPBUDRAFT_107022 [Hyphopichia burtonii NRRL Y-1933]